MNSADMTARMVKVAATTLIDQNVWLHAPELSVVEAVTHVSITLSGFILGGHDRNGVLVSTCPHPLERANFERCMRGLTIPLQSGYEEMKRAGLIAP